MKKKDKNPIEPQVPETQELINETAAPIEEAAVPAEEATLPVEATIGAETPDAPAGEDVVSAEEFAAGEKPKGGSLKGKLAGITVLQGVLYALSLPIIVIMALIFGIKTYQEMPYYSAWPFVGTIVVAVLAIIFLVVAICVTKKTAKRTIRAQTVVLLITVLVLTGVLGVAVDVILPDVLDDVASSTLNYENIYNNYDAQMRYNADLARKFIRLNLLNGNYDPQYSYHILSDTSGNAYKDAKVNASFLNYKTKNNADLLTITESLEGRKKELYDFIYNSYVLMDYDYAFLLETYNSKVFPKTRMSFALALTDRLYPVYAELCEEGMKNERIAYLFNNNYASMDQDGYVTFDDSLLLYATSGRMTVPVIIRLLLDENYTYTDGEKATADANGVISEPDGSFYYELYSPDYVAEYEEANPGDTYPYTFGGKEAAIDANGWVILKDGYVRKPIKWCVLDMDGNNMDITSLDLSSLLGEGIGGVVGPILSGVADQIGELLNEGLTNVIKVATGGGELYLHVYTGDDGLLYLTLAPSNVQKGLLGYQYMTWLQSNNLLVAVITVASTRNWLFIFGAVSLVMVFAVGCCREYKKKLRDAADAEGEAADENAAVGEEGAPLADDALSEAETVIAE